MPDPTVPPARPAAPKAAPPPARPADADTAPADPFAPQRKAVEDAGGDWLDANRELTRLSQDPAADGNVLHAQHHVIRAKEETLAAAKKALQDAMGAK